MKFSQVQDVEYMLQFLNSIDKKLIKYDKLLIKYDNKIVSANSLKIGENQRHEDIIEKIDSRIFSYSRDNRFDGLNEKSRKLFHDEIGIYNIRTCQLAEKNLFILKRVTDSCLDNKVVNSDNVFYNVDFVESAFHSDFLLVDPSTDFEIIGLVD